MISLVRADERLIHGQTMVFVVKDYSINRIIVVDDLTATNPVLKSIFQTAVPKEVQTDVHTVADSVPIIKEAINGSEKTLLLVKYPRTYVKLRELIDGLPNELNIGSQMARNGVRYAEYASLSPEDVEASKLLKNEGVRVYFNALGSSGSTIEFKD